MRLNQQITFPLWIVCAVWSLWIIATLSLLAPFVLPQQVTLDFYTLLFGFHQNTDTNTTLVSVGAVWWLYGVPVWIVLGLVTMFVHRNRRTSL